MAISLDDTECLSNFHLNTFLFLLKNKFPEIRDLIDPNLHESETYERDLNYNIKD